jgi:uncharacterized damage-inducible protein DinB
MKTALRNMLMLALAVSLSALAAHAATPPAAAPAAAPAKGAFQSDLLAVVGDAQKKALQLEEAVPQNKFNWRPAPGVRSVAEGYMHIAFANYGLTSVATGKAPPAEAGWEMNIPKWDKKTTDKGQIKKILEDSFAWSNDQIKALPDADLDKKVSFFGHEMTARAVLIILAGHDNEHLGQEVAYARANKITPPWSEGKPEGKPEAKADSKAATKPEAKK